MRKDESKNVSEALRGIGLNLHVEDASETFFNATTDVNGTETLPLNQTLNPEHKRKIIGDTFMRVSDSYVKNSHLLEKEIYLVQGTLRPDLIESASSIASSNADVIKTHHNDTQLVRDLRETGKIVEPLQEYHKDEVRELGKKLGLSDALVMRQPFPGPGLAIRILCADEPHTTEEDEEIL